MNFEELDNPSEEVGEFDINEELNFFENDPSSEYKTLKDTVIFLIDCNENLLKNGLENIFATAEGFLKTKIITNENDLFGLILYNTHTPILVKSMEDLDSKDKYNELNFEGINVLIKMTPPDAKLIKNIKNLAEHSNHVKNKDYMKYLFDQFPPSKKEISLNDALWICQTEFKNYDSKTYNRRIFLFTENDNPMVNNSNERTKTIQRAKDMLDSEIIIELFPMSVNKPFDMKIFFCDIIPQSDEDLILTKDSCIDRVKELNKRIRQKEVKKRKIGRCPFFLTKDVKIQVNCYSSIHKATKPVSHQIEAKNNKQLASLTNLLCKDSGAILYQNQIGTYHIYGGKKVLFSKDDMKNIKNLDNFGMKLMGFKDKSSIKPYYNLRTSYFLYPDDGLTEGASQIFDALIKQLIAKDKVAIVKFVSREGTNVRFCALYPQKEMFDEDLFQTPPGFNLVFLPYADDIRSTCEILKKLNIEAENVKEEQFEISKKLIKKMNFDFDSRDFENPSIQKFYAALQAIALGETEIEKNEDLLRPDKEGLKNLNGIDEEFRDLVYNGDGGKKKVLVEKVRKKTSKSREKSEESVKVGKKKRTGEDFEVIEEEKDVFENKSKKKKIVSKNEEIKGNVDEDEGYSDRVLLRMLETEGLDSLTVNKIKIILTQRNINFPKIMKKVDLIDKLNDYLFKNLK